MGTLVMKFGGASVGATPALTQVLSIVLQEHERWDSLVLVVSALDGATDALLEAAHLAQLSNRRGYRRIVATLRLRHLSLVEQLPLGVTERNALQADIDRLLFDMLDTCQSLADNPANPRLLAVVDRIISVGERLAARIVAALLRQNNLRGVAIDATDLVVTDAAFGNAVPNTQLTRQRITQNLLPMLGRDIIPVITGFIGATETGQPTTLGRGGSDYTASIIAVALDAEEVWMWTGVDGIMTADPNELADARVIPLLSYEEVAELAYFGARILHSRMIGPLREHRIPLRVKNVFRPREAGTLVRDTEPTAAHAIKAVTAISGLGLTAAYSGPLTAIADLIDETLFQAVSSHTEVMISAQSSYQSFVCFVIPTSAGPEAAYTVQAALEAALRERKVGADWQARPVSIITIIGKHFNIATYAAAEVLQTLSDIHILGMSQGPASCGLSLVLPPEDGDRALRQIHATIISKRSDSAQVPTV